MTKADDLGDRMKSYERHETGRMFLRGLPVYARIDGRGFSRFTKGMERPFDPRMTKAMQAVCAYLVSSTNAVLGYVQSDEISLLWMDGDPNSQPFFGGKVQKLVSVLASMAAAKMAQEIRGWEPFEDRLPAFDARVMVLPSKEEAANMILWRALDAQKNAVSMAARAHYSGKALHGKNGLEMKAMLSAAGHPYSELPDDFRFGSFYRRETLMRPLSEVAQVHRLRHQGVDGEASPMVMRTVIQRADMPPFNKIINRADVIFDKAEPILLGRFGDTERVA